MLATLAHVTYLHCRRPRKFLLNAQVPVHVRGSQQLVHDRVRRIGRQRILIEVSKLLEPGCSAAIRVRGRVAEDLRRGCGRSSGLDVVNDVGENHIIEDTEAGLHNSLAGAEQFRAIGNAEPGSPRLGYGLLVVLQLLAADGKQAIWVTSMPGYGVAGVLNGAPAY